ncbi:protein of unknown function [Streptomyces murinus]
MCVGAARREPSLAQKVIKGT